MLTEPPSTDAEIEPNERQRLLDRYSEIAQLAGGLAHEIRNPLSTIMMNLELMSEDVSPEDSPRDGRIQRRIDTVQRECHHLEAVLNAFLQFTRAGELETAPADLNSLVLDFINFYRPKAEEAGIEISPHLAPDLPPVSLDAALFRQVLMNLAQNAQQAMPEGGLLELQTEVVNGRVRLGLIDTGAGMDDGTVERIFDAFFSTRTGGSGLGLPTVKKIVEAHGGEIACESAPGRGTRFAITFSPAGG